MKRSRWRRLVHRLHHTATRIIHAAADRGRRALIWAHARRRTALSQALRGLCFGTGSGLITLLIYWYTRR